MALIQKAFSDIITFSRSSNATRVGPTGVLEYAPHNLLTYSEQFDNAAWTKYEGSVVANSIAAPNGTVTADTYIPSTNNTNHHLYSSATINTNTVYTFSCYAKAAGYIYFDLGLIFNSTVYSGAQFNLSNGTVVRSGAGSGETISNPTISSVGNGWYRCSVTVSTTNAGLVASCQPSNVEWTSGAFHDQSFAGNGTSGAYLWGAQLAVGPYALDYVPTTSAAVYGPRFDYDGSGVTIVEPVSTNLVTYSQEFDNAAWTKSNASITANAIAAPDGTITADKLVENTSNGFHYAYQGTSTATGTYTYSILLKSAGRSFAWIYAYTGVSATAYFDLANGTVGTVSGSYSPTATITSVGNGWYRCTMTFAATDVNFACGVGAATANGTSSYTGDGTSGIYVWGAQLEVGSTATAYMVSGASNGFRAVPVVSGSATPKGLLVEEQRQNLVTYSEQFDNAAWTKGSGFTLTANAIASPDGTVNADLFVRGTTSSFAYLSQIISGNASQATTFSCWVRTVSGTSSIRLVISDFSFTSLNSSALSINTTWQRLSFSIAAGQLANTGSIGVGFLMDVGQSAYFWGAQLEANASFASSYIPTLASAVTRTADVASVNTLSPWFNATEGTLFAEAAPLIANSGVSRGIFGLSSGISSNSMSLYINSSGTLSGGYIANGGFDQADLTLSYSNKTALAYKANDVNMAAGGAIGTTDTSATIPTISQVQLGDIYGGSSFKLNGHLRRIAYYPRRLTNAELAALTA